MNRTWRVVAGLLVAGVWMGPALAQGNPWRAQSEYYGRSDPTMTPVPKPAPGFGQPGEESLYPPENADETLTAPSTPPEPEYPPLEGALPEEQPSRPDPVYPPTPEEIEARKEALEPPPLAPIRPSPGVQVRRPPQVQAPGRGPAPAPMVPGQGMPAPVVGDPNAGGVPTVGYGLPGQAYPGYGYTAPGNGYDPLYWNALNPGAASIYGWGAPGLGVPGFLGGTPWIGTPSTGWGW